ncbi:MAG: sulfotransferase [Cyanobacteria bacterium P01_A01_bin.17]
MDTKGPIFLVGCPRSGTTLLQQMLDAHPDVAIAPETFFMERFWLQRNRYGPLAQDSSFHQLLEDIIALPEFDEMGLSPIDFRKAAWQSERTYPAVFHLLLEQFSELSEAKVVGEKTPKHILHMEALLQFFPAARFIHIVRDPRAVATSWQQVPWSTGSLTGDTRVWRRYVTKTRYCSPLVKSVLLTLHYEQLVSQPERELHALCRFLDLEYQSAMMNYARRESQLVNVAREPWKANARRPLSRSSLNRWQTELSSSALLKIEAAAGSEMKYFGYQPVTHTLPLLPAKLLMAMKSGLRELPKLLKTNDYIQQIK